QFLCSVGGIVPIAQQNHFPSSVRRQDRLCEFQGRAKICSLLVLYLGPLESTSLVAKRTPELAPLGEANDGVLVPRAHGLQALLYIFSARLSSGRRNAG